jgi:hypothetical protein
MFIIIFQNHKINFPDQAFNDAFKPKTGTSVRLVSVKTRKSAGGIEFDTFKLKY